jgi:hypothetical protein
MTTRPKRRPSPLTDEYRAAAARLILEDHRRFLSDPDADPKAFAARHAAGKAALAHLEQLMKTGCAGEDEEEADAGEADGGHLSAARAAMASLGGEGAGTDDGDG